ncbi:P-loop containing nucleoside triphosphate hydrolase protein [Mycena crocata]|nr:P-loop containing nucleoside triphosphate hydrolase protein [Mycena crocata]
MLPSAPHIFHGRDAELRGLVAILLQDGGRAAILGPGGIGKTTLARAAVHQVDVAEKYCRRYWVSCESASTVGDLVSAVALGLGIDAYGGGLSKAVIRSLSATGPCLLVLDNFETPWESGQSRSQAEAFLALVADILHVTLLITMRGVERPLNVRWTHPFPAPLIPVTESAAHQILSDISDIDDEAQASDLLTLTGNLPLAVTLMAGVASVEGCEGTLARWKLDNISVISGGYSKDSNLELSLRLSLSSPRVRSAPEVLGLLSLLSVLPDGASDDVLAKASAHFLPHKTTLLRTSLAYNDSDGRLMSLPPVREYVKKMHGPSPSMVRDIRIYLGI